MSADSLADTKALLASTAERLGPNPPIRPVGPAGFPGYVAWNVGPEHGGVLVVMPRLLPGAPASLRRRYRDRILANATGTCPRCTANTDAAHVHQGQMAHEPTCTLVFGPRDERWFDRGEAS